MKFSFALVFSLIVLLGYAYVVFLGMVYWQDGRFLMPVVVISLFLAVTGLCLMAMCKAKASRWRRRALTGQTVFGGFLLLAFLASSVPLTNFLDVLSRQTTIRRQAKNLLVEARQLDDSYVDYARQRLDNYQYRLELVSLVQILLPREYNELLGWAEGRTDVQKIAWLTDRLRQQLLPDSLTSVQHERQALLRRTSDMRVWNPLLPSLIASINDGADRWADDYQQLSEEVPMGEDAEPFSYPTLSSPFQSLAYRYTQLHVPSPLAVAVALLCFIIILLPYWLTGSSLALRETGILYE